MKVAIHLGADVIEKALEIVIKAFGHERVESVDEAEIIILSDDTRQMLASLKRGKRVVQFLIQPSMEPAIGLLTAYPAQFMACAVIAHKGLQGVEALYAYLQTLEQEKKV